MVPARSWKPPQSVIPRMKTSPDRGNCRQSSVPDNLREFRIWRSFLSLNFPVPAFSQDSMNSASPVSFVSSASRFLCFLDFLCFLEFLPSPTPPICAAPSPHPRRCVLRQKDPIIGLKGGESELFQEKSHHRRQRSGGIRRA